MSIKNNRERFAANSTTSKRLDRHSSRYKRRAEQRKAERAERKARVAAKLKANPRLVRA